MEYAKDIILDLNQGQVKKKKQQKVKSLKKQGICSRIVRNVWNHKMMTTVVVATISFMVIDVLLVSNFIKLLCNWGQTTIAL